MADQPQPRALFPNRPTSFPSNLCALREMQEAGLGQGVSCVLYVRGRGGARDGGVLVDEQHPPGGGCPLSGCPRASGKVRNMSCENREVI